MQLLHRDLGLRGLPARAIHRGIVPRYLSSRTIHSTHIKKQPKISIKSLLRKLVFPLFLACASCSTSMSPANPSVDQLKDLSGAGSNACEILSKTSFKPAVHTAGIQQHASFTRFNQQWGIPDIYGPMSACDINKDGAPDLFAITDPFVGATRDQASLAYKYKIQLLLNCVNYDGRFYTLDLFNRVDSGFNRILNPEILPKYGMPSSTAMADLDGDGLPELIMAFEGTDVFSKNGVTESLYALHNEGGLRFRIEKLYEAVPDTRITTIRPLNISGHGTDLYCTTFDTRHSASVLEYISDEGADLFFVNNGDRTFTEVIHSKGKDILDASKRYTNTASLSSRVAFGLNPIFFLGTDGGWSFAYEYKGNFSFSQIFGLGGEFSLEDTKVISTMGIATKYDKDGVLSIITTQTAQSPVIQIDVNNIVTIREDLIHINNGPYISWGVVSEDFNNDGYQDIMEATGMPEDVAHRSDPMYKFQRWGGATDKNHLLSLPYDKVSGSYVDSSATAGPQFNGQILSDTYGLITADFDGDGYSDVAASPMNIAGQGGMFSAYNTPNIVMRNDGLNQGNFIGFKLPLSYETGTMVVLEVGSTKMVREVGQSTSIAMMSDDHTIHFGLGSMGEGDIKSVTIIRPDGTKKTLVPKINSYSVIE